MPRAQSGRDSWARRLRGQRALPWQKRAEGVLLPSWRGETKGLTTPPPPERGDSAPSRAGWGVNLPRQEERKQAVITGQLPASSLAASLRARRAWPRGIRVSNCPDLFLHLSRPRGRSPALLLGLGFQLRAARSRGRTLLARSLHVVGQPSSPHRETKSYRSKDKRAIRPSGRKEQRWRGRSQTWEERGLPPQPSPTERGLGPGRLSPAQSPPRAG